jgi:hypothetical protein
MKKTLLKLTTFAAAIIFANNITAQSPGTLTFTFTEASHATNTTYNGNAQHDLAVWIQTSAGAFVKTKLRYAGGGTSDHLPTWASQASCAGGNAISTGCNTIDGTTGATRSAWSTYTISWDGKKGAASTGTLQPDGVYKVAIQSTWNHGTTGTALTTYTFTKSNVVDHQTPANTTNFTGVTINWQPALVTGLNDAGLSSPKVSIYPNPTNGIFNVDYARASNIKVFHTLGGIV